MSKDDLNSGNYIHARAILIEHFLSPLVVGALLGSLTAIGIGAGSMWPVGAIIGFVGGIPIIPIQMLALRRKNPLKAILCVYVPAFFVWVAPTILAHSPRQTMIWTVIAILSMNILVSLLMNDELVVTSILQCRNCGYNLQCNHSGTCPECGNAIPKPQLNSIMRHAER